MKLFAKRKTQTRLKPHRRKFKSGWRGLEKTVWNHGANRGEWESWVYSVNVRISKTLCASLTYLKVNKNVTPTNGSVWSSPQLAMNNGRLAKRLLFRRPFAIRRYGQNWRRICRRNFYPDIIIIGDEAQVSGQIEADIVVISGKFTGDIYATQRVEIQPPAIVGHNSNCYFASGRRCRFRWKNEDVRSRSRP